MTPETLWGVNSTLIYLITALLSVLLLLVLFYRRNKLSRARFHLILVMGILWLLYSLLNLLA